MTYPDSATARTEPADQPDEEDVLTSMVHLFLVELVKLKVAHYVTVELLLIYSVGLSPDAAHQVVQEVFPIDQE